jgi:hypothetical protein
MKLLKLVIENKFTIIFWLIATYIAWYGLEVGAKYKDLLLIPDKGSVTVFKPEYNYESQLKLVTSEGEEIREPVFASKYYFFNNGKEEVQHDDIKSPLIFSLPNKAKVISFAIDKVTRPAIDFKLHKPDKNSNNKLQIDFDFLDYKDGASFTILYTADSYVTGQIKGDVLGVREVGSSANIPETHVIARWGTALVKWLCIIGGGILAFLIMLYCLLFCIDTIRIRFFALDPKKAFTAPEESSSSAKTSTDKKELFYILFIIVLFLLATYLVVRHSMKTDVTELIPKLAIEAPSNVE